MLIDTHCHMNMMVKNSFDTPLTAEMFPFVQKIVLEAQKEDVCQIINIGTSIIESQNCITLAQKFPPVFATIGIHPNDVQPNWKKDFPTLQKWATEKEAHKIVGIGECGLDFHYPAYDLQRQKDAFKAQIELALEHDLALVVHTRDAHDETLHVLQEYEKHALRGTIHCFSEDISFAQQSIAWGFVLGIGGIITYPKNDQLREVVKTVGIEKIILETDAPFLPPQIIRGKQNHPVYIRVIADYCAQLLKIDFEKVASITTNNAQRIFQLPEINDKK
ncbi:MAG: TatD family hydrolase [Candidatus Babeliaceae bacterium]